MSHKYKAPPCTISGELTAREKEVVVALVAGATDYPALQAALSLKEGTIRTHLKYIYLKTRVHNLTALLLWAVRNGYYKEQNA